MIPRCLFLVLFSLIGHSLSDSVVSNACPSLLQKHKLRFHQDPLFEDAAPTCVPLSNGDGSFNVMVKVGTPAQTFSLIADTGSDDLVVQSCQCQQTGKCPKSFGSCFQDEGSRTLSVSMFRNKLEKIVMSYGSGNLGTFIASDVVKVGQIEAFMNNSLLLFTNQFGSFGSRFEGILGLGIPHSDATIALEDGPAVPLIYPFLEVAGIPRFSLCANYNSDGVLAFNTGTQPLWLGSSGVFHWGLNFAGISVGDVSAPAHFCLPNDITSPLQKSACAVIPDSGTTLITGPEAQILQLYDEICKQWQRCALFNEALVAKLGTGTSAALDEVYNSSSSSILTPKLKTALERLVKYYRSQGKSSPAPKPHEVFRYLLQNCGIWLSSQTAMNEEMPSLYFNVVGTEGHSQSLLITPFDYVFETTFDVVRKSDFHFDNFHPSELDSREDKTICSAAFGAMNYTTLVNGPVWILGSPLFYRYNVNYNRESSPPGMYFSSDKCGQCVDGHVEESDVSLASTTGASVLRKVETLRSKQIDTSRPF